MFSRLCLATGLLLVAASPTAQQPLTLDQALAQIAKVEGTVKFDEQRKVPILIDI
jgi:hypothetical protein